MYLGCFAMKCFICIIAFNLNKLHVEFFVSVPSHYLYPLLYFHWLCAFSNACSYQIDGSFLSCFPFAVAYFAIVFMYLSQNITVYPLISLVALSATV